MSPAFTGQSASQLKQMMDAWEKTVDHRIAMVTPLPQLAADTRSQLEAGIAGANAEWAVWKANLTNDPVCDAAVQRMQGHVTNMANALLKWGDGNVKAYATDHFGPEVGSDIPLPPQQAGANAQDPSGAQVAAPNGTATAQPAVLHGVARAGQAPGTVVGASTQPAGVGAAAQATPAASHGSTAGLQLAGAATLAPPPAPTTAATGMPSFVPAAGSVGAMGATAPGAAVPAGGVAGVGGGGMAPFLPMAPGLGVGTGAGVANGDRKRDEEDKPSRGGVVPPIAPNLGGKAGARAAARIRPGTAAKPGKTGVTAGLSGRAVEAGPTASSTKRRRTTGRHGRADGQATVHFLDEEAWQTDDPGSGVLGVEVEEQHQNTVATATVH